MRFRVLLLVVFVIGTLLGCATANQNVGKVLVVACGGCGMLQDSGVCAVVTPPVEAGVVSSSSRTALPTESAATPAPVRKVVLPTCVAPKQLWVVNFSDVMDKKAAPKLECR